ncbi:MAG: NAD(P)-dependent oxidoreductase, partial [Planctomycetota bacterium]|nr:NAD(P)-dependent oxidoreductase [Planctomycetota bacterium]
MSHVLVCDDLHPAALDVFRARGLTPTVRTGMSEDELVEAVAGVEAVVVRSATKVTRRVIEAADALRVVGRAGIGVDNVDCDAATERGVVVMNTPTGNATTTAEHALALLFSLARHVPRADRLVRGGSWNKTGLTGIELSGKTLGIVGLGRIGRLVAERALGLRMQVCAFDPYLAEAGRDAPIGGVELLGLHELLRRADFLTLHVPHNDSTHHLISWEELAQIKAGALLINAARGGVV